MADSLYCYPNSNVLKNKLGIEDLGKLQTFERKLTMLRIAELLDKPIRGHFDFDHLKSIHHFIFQDIYDWAGEVRKVDIAKAHMFCNVKFIDNEAARIFGELNDDLKLMPRLSQEEFAKKLAYYFAEINALHPFREGNGRSQREFIRQLALAHGYLIKFSLISDDEMLQASLDSFMCDYKSIEQLISKCLFKY